jgi:hypothetical protein
LTRHERRPFRRLTDAVAAYLETLGWRAVVIGAPRVQSWPDPLGDPVQSEAARLGKYEFVVEFTGGRREAGKRRRRRCPPLRRAR